MTARMEFAGVSACRDHGAFNILAPCTIRLRRGDIQKRQSSPSRDHEEPRSGCANSDSRCKGLSPYIGVYRLTQVSVS